MRTTVSVDGLKQFTRSLKDLDAALPKQVRVALNASADFLIGRAQPKIPTRSGAARASLRARSSRTAVRIAVGGRRAPYYPWLDFGGRVGPDDSVARPFLTEGRYLYPTLRQDREKFTKIMAGALTDLATGAGLDVSR